MRVRCRRVGTLGHWVRSRPGGQDLDGLHLPGPDAGDGEARPIIRACVTRRIRFRFHGPESCLPVAFYRFRNSRLGGVLLAKIQFIAPHPVAVGPKDPSTPGPWSFARKPSPGTPLQPTRALKSRSFHWGGCRPALVDTLRRRFRCQDRDARGSER
jgi:hypothetical protein